MSDLDYKFKFTVTPPKGPDPEEVKCVLGEYHNYFSMSQAIETRRRKWVPFWLWRLVSESRFIGDDRWY